MLAHTIFGATSNTERVVLVHGFSQTRESWARLLEHLPHKYHYMTIDAPGHGESSLESGDLFQTADQLVATAGPAVYCGYSMGARMCLHAALAHPDAVTGLILISGTAGIDNDAERHKRHESDQQLAQHILDVGVDTFVDEWLTQPMFSTLPRDEKDRKQRKANTTRGLANNLLATGTGSQLPLWDRLAELRMPVLIIAGANDTKFVAIAERLHHCITSSQLEIVVNAGHAVHYEKPAIVASVIEHWLNANIAQY
ncbi:MAG: 2-succinyl-6-hydroxy-2,4-cyclohexadiene-1-carboxylate synthase [Ilumatobacteraceae bacterium]